MFNNITESLRQKHVGVDLLHGKIKAFEIKNDYLIDLSVEELLLETVDPMNINSFWHDASAMKKILLVLGKVSKIQYLEAICLLQFPLKLQAPKKKNLFLKQQQNLAGIEQL